MMAEIGYRANTIAPTETAENYARRAETRTVHVIAHRDGRATVRGMRIIFDTLDDAYAAALESVFCAQSSYYMGTVRVSGEGAEVAR